MSQISENNKRIAKNTLALYFRTFITLIVGLYTGRVMLQALGVDNYGINAVVGGIVGMSSLLTGTMAQSVSRYLTYALGAGDREKLRTMFSTSVNAQVAMAAFAMLLLEVAGVWFLNTGANIPEGRMSAANCVLQCSLVMLAISLVSSPFSALIVAHERMGVYAYFSVVDVILRLGICFTILAYGGDRLVLFALLQVALTMGMQGFYVWYCRRHFEESAYSPRCLDRGLLKELTVFSGWNFLAGGAWTFSTQGVSILVNVFFGVTMNTSRAIATTVDSAILSFVSNFTMAFSPQITKSYAAGDVRRAVYLANQGTRFTWLLMFVFIVPVCMEADAILALWLGEVPPLAALFLRFTLFESVAVCSGQHLLKLIQADGRVKRYTLQGTLVAGLIFPLTWLLYRLGAPVWSCYVVFILDFAAVNAVRLYNLRRLMDFSISVHLRDALLPSVAATLLSFALPLFLVCQLSPGIFRFIVVCAVSVVWTAACGYLVGLKRAERGLVWAKLKELTGRRVA